ncbi:MAG: CbiX/SirB N-terminal domain-containing protein [Halomonas sp.]|uniref:CbiX/SirB N-terminal domain-containing protein n=2 Tax=Halomonadaceae TaxID=28256 RepID=A0ABS6ZJS4_9GAMM|nr:MULTISPECIES: CbiX/SirB N-terminal domain-containing protein [Halomonas]MBW6390328.1 CbiX/SirB N-terminal domain-containing protein [Halomonas antri]MDX5379477.1 CbiX/SirB N-terminal domain-containing protein [Halomonas sp.]QTP60523.1 CbiX/SirB N-terminal domain-containing protein [Halomonas sulfidivorans]
MTYSLILLAHGSSDPAWRAPFEHFHASLATRMQVPLKLAYMELSEPSLESSVAELASAGLRRADILPLFFAAGRHLRKDVPAQVEALRSSHPDIELRLLPPVGEHPAFIDALAAVVAEQAGEALST